MLLGRENINSRLDFLIINGRKRNKEISKEPKSCWPG